MLSAAVPSAAAQRRAAALAPAPELAAPRLAVLPEQAELAFSHSLHSWAAVHGGPAAPGSEHRLHTHPEILVSGVYFVPSLCCAQALHSL